MELGELTFSFSSVQWLLTIGVGIYAWMIGRQSARAAEVLEIRLRLAELETRMTNSPTPDQMAALGEKIAHMDARLGGLADSIIPVGKSLDRINDYLLKNR